MAFVTGHAGDNVHCSPNLNGNADRLQIVSAMAEKSGFAQTATAVTTASTVIDLTALASSKIDCGNCLYLDIWATAVTSTPSDQFQFVVCFFDESGNYGPVITGQTLVTTVYRVGASGPFMTNGITVPTNSFRYATVSCRSVGGAASWTLYTRPN